MLLNIMGHGRNQVQNLKKNWDIPGGSVVKNLPCNAGNMSLIPG